MIQVSILCFPFQDGRTIFTASTDKTVGVFDTMTGTIPVQLIYKIHSYFDCYISFMGGQTITDFSILIDLELMVLK